MNPQILALLMPFVEQILVPEIMTAVRAHRNATNGTMPTDEQVIAALAVDTEGAISVGKAWLAAHPTT